MTTSIPVGTTKEIFNRFYTYIDIHNTGEGEWRLTNIPPIGPDGGKGIYAILPIIATQDPSDGVVSLTFSMKRLQDFSSNFTTVDPTNEVYTGLSTNKAYLPIARNTQLTVDAIAPITSKENDDNVVLRFNPEVLDPVVLNDKSKKARRMKMKVKLTSYNEGSATVLKGILPMEVQALDDTSTVSFNIIDLPSI